MNALTTEDKRIAIALEAALATAEPFEAWLASQPDDAAVGTAQESDVCPIAAWIRGVLAPTASTIRVYSNRVTVALPTSGTAGVLFFDRGSGFADELAAFVYLVDQPEVRGVEPLADDITRLAASDPDGEEVRAQLEANRRVTAKVAREVLIQARTNPQLGVLESEGDEDEEDEDDDFEDDLDDPDEDDFEDDDDPDDDDDFDD